MSYTLDLITESNFEKVIFQIGNILKEEEINQKEKAIEGGFDSGDYSFNVGVEIFTPILETDLKIPFVNVYYSSKDYNEVGRGSVHKQNAVYFIDIYTKADNKDLQEGLTVSSGTNNRVIRQIYGILGSAKYKDSLGLSKKDVEGKDINFIRYTTFSNDKKFIQKEGGSDNVIFSQLVFEVGLTQDTVAVKGVAGQIGTINVGLIGDDLIKKIKGGKNDDSNS